MHFLLTHWPRLCLWDSSCCHLQRVGSSLLGVMYVLSFEMTQGSRVLQSQSCNSLQYVCAVFWCKGNVPNVYPQPHKLKLKASEWMSLISFMDSALICQYCLHTCLMWHGFESSMTPFIKGLQLPPDNLLFFSLFYSWLWHFWLMCFKLHLGFEEANFCALV